MPTTLRAFIAWLLSAAGLGLIAYTITKGLDDHTRFNVWPAHLKRLGAFGIAIATVIIIAPLTSALGAWMGYLPLPATPQAWVEGLGNLLIPTILTSQTIHLREISPKARYERLTFTTTQHAAQTKHTTRHVL